MLKAITAPPGGGKTCYSMSLIVRELMLTNRPVVTNVAVKVEPWVLNGVVQIGLREYLRRKGYRGPDITERIRLLDDDQTKTFWRYRLGKDMPESPLTPSGNVAFQWPNDGGVLYIIDELHDHFNAMEWGKVSKEGLFYISKHRHIGDDIYGISQAMSNVVKQFRVLIQETILVRNLGMEKLGVFKLPTRTLIRGYMYCPTNFKSETPMWSSLVHFDSGSVRETYNTAGAVKGAMSSGDVGVEKTRGLPIWTLFAGAAALFAAIVYVTEAGPKALVGSGETAKVEAVLSEKHSDELPRDNIAPPPVSQPSVKLEPIPESDLLYMTGYCMTSKGYMVTMSDGRVLRSWTGGFDKLEPRRVSIDGVWYPLKDWK